MTFQRGLGEAVTGIIGGILINVVLAEFAKEELIPSYLVFLFAVAGFLGAIALFMSLTAAGFIFTLGWIIGAWILKDLFGPIDFVVYLVVPVAALVIGAVLFFKRQKP